MSSGVIPQNSLQRNGKDICTNPDAAFAQIINRGMQMESEARFDSMQGLILKLSSYNVKPFAPEIVAVQNTHSQKKKKSRKRIPVAAAVLVVVLTILVAAVSAYFVGYQRAYQLAQSGDYAAARQCLFVPQITQMHDQQIGVYIEAGSLMDSGQYAEAKKLFQSLPGFLNSDTMALETDYRYAAQLADMNEFNQAILKYNLLVASDYKDAKEKAVETRYRKALFLIYEEQDYLGAKSLLASPDLDSMENIVAVRNELNELLYQEAIELYRGGSYIAAGYRFPGGYKDSEKYQLLIQAHNNADGYATADYYAETILKLRKIFYFEDASDVLLSSQSFAEEFLRGDWRSTAGGKYFKMDAKGSISYNLPWIDYGDYYEIQNGNLLLYPKNNPSATRTMYSITALSPDQIQVYCHKDGSTYILNRQ